MTKRETENGKSRNSKYFQEENTITKKTQLPEFDKYKKMNMITLHPPVKLDNNDEEFNKYSKTYQKTKRNESSNKYHSAKENTSKELEEERIKKALFEIAKEHIYMFQKITKKVVEKKYNKIFEDIYHFIIKLDFYKDSFLQTLLINTDQNADMFFDIMENHFKEKSERSQQIENESSFNQFYNNRNYNFFILKESNFYDLKNLFIDLQLYEDRELKEDADMDILPENSSNNLYNIEDEKNNFYRNNINIASNILPVNIIIVREIHLINPVNFNIFLTKLIDFNQVKNKNFSNIILFDVSYDPKGLFEKIKPNILTKIVFNNLDYISSKTIYKEILYDFVHGKKKISDSGEFSFFIPNSNKTKKIIDYVTTHQISIPSFEYYFKFLILEFFVFRKWPNMHFLIYHADLFSKLKKTNFKKNNKREFNRDDYIPLIKAFFKENLKQIKKTEKVNEKEIEDLIDIYLKTKNTREVFLTIYEFFENIIEKLGGFENDEYNKNDFIFDFLQFGEEKIDRVSSNRTELIIGFIQEKSYIHNIIKNLILPELEKLSKNFEENTEQRKIIIETKDKIDSIFKENPGNHNTKELSKLLISKNQSNNNSNINNNARILKILESGNDNDKNKDNNYNNTLYDKNSLLNTENKKNSNNINNIFDDNISLLSDKEMLFKLKVKLNEFFNNKIFKEFDNVTNMQDQDICLAISDIEKYQELDVDNITSKGNSASSKYLHNEEIQKYLNFNEITNPSMQSLFIKDILDMQIIIFDKNYAKSEIPKNSYYQTPFLVKRVHSKDLEIDIDNFWNNINYSKMFKLFIHVYANLGLEFKLKFFFSDFLLKFKFDFQDNKKLDALRNVFFKFCNEFYLLGLISRKRPNSDIFVKNFFKMASYFIKEDN